MLICKEMRIMAFPLCQLHLLLIDSRVHCRFSHLFLEELIFVEDHQLISFIVEAGTLLTNTLLTAARKK